MSVQFSLLPIVFMSPVDLKKRPCRRVEFKGQGPQNGWERGETRGEGRVGRDVYTSSWSLVPAETAGRSLETFSSGQPPHDGWPF